MKSARQNSSSKPVVLAIDVGGTRIKLALVQGAVLRARQEIEAHASQGLKPALERIVGTLPALCRTAGLTRDQLAGCGVAFPGIIEPGSGQILSTPAGKFDDAAQVDLSRWVRQRLGVPCEICNDANAALLAEWRLGAARGCDNVVMMTLGTGIGTSAIIEGHPLRGRHGQAGCLGGHLTTQLDGSRCNCGNLGCGETAASTWALPQHAREHPNFAESRLAQTTRLDYAAVFAVARQRDVAARELRDRAIQVWSAVLVSLIHAYDPEVIVVGGGILRSAALLLPRFRRYVARHAWTPWGHPRVRAAKFGNDAGLLGVATLFSTAA